MIRTRFAPSPTGDLHLGGAWTALASWLVARQAGGKAILRMEDLDAPRVRAGAADRVLDDLAWLGLGWDEGPREGGPRAPYAQSSRQSLYAAAVDDLSRLERVYPCDCSRKDIALRATEASAPHGLETRYPGTCRDKPHDRAFKREPALRFRVPEGSIVGFTDAIVGPVSEDVGEEVGDFVLRRGDGLFAYQLAVVVDDWQMEISDVVRGDDLLASTARQILLGGCLGARTPRFWHVPLVVTGSGDRLEKRTFPKTVRELREAGVAPETIVGQLAHGLGFAETPIAARPEDLVGSAWSSPRREPWPVPPELS